MTFELSMIILEKCMYMSVKGNIYTYIYIFFCKNSNCEWQKIKCVFGIEIMIINIRDFCMSNFEILLYFWYLQIYNFCRIFNIILIRWNERYSTNTLLTIEWNISSLKPSSTKKRTQFKSITALSYIRLFFKSIF